MGSKDPRVDAYIARAAPFAQPILSRLRRVVHAGCPSVVETIKWGVPYFEYHGVLCTMAAFRSHCTFELGSPATPALRGAAAERFGRITRAADLPADAALKARIAQAAARTSSRTDEATP